METWSDVAEIQPMVCKVITNSIKKNRISHAYLLQGARGTGKEDIAVLIAKVLFCKNKTGADPCLTCTDCKRIDSRNHPDVHWIEPDGQSIKIEQIKNLQKEFTYSGLESDQKVYMIKGADTLTANAANRILKFLEEPSKKTTAIMMTENSQAILPTIRSRCQIIDLQPLNPEHFQQRLVDSGLNETTARLMSALTNNLDEALEWSQDEWFAVARKVVVQLVEAFTDNSNDVYLFIHNHWLPTFKERKQLEQGIDLLLLAFKDILYYHLDHVESLTFFQQGERLERLGMYFSQGKLTSTLHDLLDAKRKLKQNVHPTLVMEQLTLQIER
ncbi:DNA polymerase III subunit delta' [Ornithinibacillus sp. BX22]|uniref:DNA polymerase III subunit delta' n=1 Tax=Ornithinibacillus hominis TaxID=2763055 RepID=A0A923L8B6_9BACI|nr:DNA polymerase III subunit delta' [Ornithinibacillus hominis]MBC5638385.1 DNA polymerase III subunit delta' [Ornithinibacillus hominis]